MDTERALATLISYPLVILLIIDWARAWPRRGVNTGDFVREADKQARIEVVGRKLILVRLFVLFAILWATNRSLLGNLFQLASMHIPSAAITGVTFGLALILAGRLFSPTNGYFKNGSIAFWMAVFFVGAFVEEIWRAICVVDFQEIGWSAPEAALVTALAFAAAHLAGRPSRILPACFLFELIVGLALATSFVRTGSLVAPIAANLLYFTVSFLLARKRLDQFTDTQ
jgi:hypothetical protein